METIEFRQRVAGRKDPWIFPAAGISDGTLRGLGVLVALLQSNGRPPTLVGVEEPEVALHPGAVAILIDAINDASRHTQIVITSHSPDLLDREDMDHSVIRAVVAQDGVTVIGPISEPGRSAIQDHLFTAGELLRMNHLEPGTRRAGSAARPQISSAWIHRSGMRPPSDWSGGASAVAPAPAEGPRAFGGMSRGPISRP